MTQVRGQVKDGAVEHFQVGIKSGSASRTTDPPFGAAPALAS